jgi:hypothetical protein
VGMTISWNVSCSLIASYTSSFAYEEVTKPKSHSVNAVELNVCLNLESSRDRLFHLEGKP